MVDNDEPVIIVLRVATITKDKEIVNDTCCGWDNDDDNICGKKKKPFLLLGSVNQSLTDEEICRSIPRVRSKGIVHHHNDNTHQLSA